MGQTLTHGVYLPDEGERNCYSGLASNWSILDGAVGTVAEHTTALAGKAPLVHTHTKSDITDFPAYGNAAGTICEGNDSRLSDARTPVAHTHTKSDVTDLLNSNFIPSANNSYDLGSSSYQWNNAYIKSLTINGVAAGDILTHNVSEFVGVSGNQTIGGVKEFNNISASDTLKAKKYINFNDNSIIYISGGRGWNLGGQINLIGKDNVTRDDSGNIVTDGGDLVLRCTSNLCGIFDVTLNVNNSIKEPQFSPTHNKINLGTSTNKWKSFNGINPGALSLPRMAYISIDTTGFDVTATTIGAFTPTVDGWAILSITQKNKPFGIWIVQGSYRVTFQSVYHQGDYMIFALIPALANLNLTIYCTADDIDSTRKIDWLRLFPCQGNV